MNKFLRILIQVVVFLVALSVCVFTGWLAGWNPWERGIDVALWFAASLIVSGVATELIRAVSN